MTGLIHNRIEIFEKNIQVTLNENQQKKMKTNVIGMSYHKSVVC